MKIILIFSLILFTIENSFSQFRYDITIDTTKNQCSVFEINDKSKKFAVHKFSDCKKIDFYQKDNLMVLWDTKNICHLTDIRKGFVDNKSVVFMDIQSIQSVKSTDNKHPFNRNGRAVDEYLYHIEYTNTDNHSCEIKVDKEWFMIFENTCKK